MANFNFNKVIIGGRLTADPELKTTSDGISVTSFSLAVNRREAKADFFTIIAWRQTAEFITRHFQKGSSICIVGFLHTRSWVDNNNVKQYRTEIVAEEVFFVDAKVEQRGGISTAASVSSAGEKKEASPVQNSFEEIEDTDLPF
ncbi:MAG: single-stranded DNA-binding protein [Clostridiales bacterium]|jgi:single-strand binding protein|nr:single-stranded DNA-binding protein [Clostridiales bacterium]